MKKIMWLLGAEEESCSPMTTVKRYTDLAGYGDADTVVYARGRTAREAMRNVIQYAVIGGKVVRV